MSDTWYENSNAICSYQNDAAANGSFVQYEASNTATEDVSKHTALMSSLHAASLQNCFYPQAQDYHSSYNNHTDATMKSDGFQEAGHFDGYNFSTDYGRCESSLRWPQGNPNLVSQYPTRFWPRTNRRMTPAAPPKDSPIKVILENKSLMECFNQHCTEMIITKTGRRMFPSPQISLEGLEANVKYFVLFDIVPADDNRYKFHHFNWVIAGKAEPHPPARLYIHPESPLTGSQWMKQQITFHKVKLTNNACDQHGHMILNSMHRYQPRVHIVAACDVYSIQFQPFHTFAFPECQFIAVTAYQNSQITYLKIEHNPFAKGFRKPDKDKRSKRKLDDQVKVEPAENEEEISEKASEDQQLGKFTEEKKDVVPTKRDIGYCDLSHDKWNYNPNDTFYSSQKSSYPYDMRRLSPPSVSFTSPRNETVTMSSSSSPSQQILSPASKLPYFDASKFASTTDSGLSSYEHARQLCFPSDFLMPPCNKANIPSFI